MTTWANQIRQAVKRSGMTLYAVAKAAQLDYPRVYLFMAGRVGTVRLETAERIARVVGLELRSARRGKRKGR